MSGPNGMDPQKWLKNAKSVLLNLLGLALLLRILLWAIQPLIGYIIIGLTLVFVISFLFHRHSKL